eukprot:6134850-Pyramimonas_sp.AAC.1
MSNSDGKSNAGSAKPPPWKMAVDPAQASQISEDDSDEIKKAKLAAQLACFDASIKSLPRSSETEELRQSIQAKIDDIK